MDQSRNPNRRPPGSPSGGQFAPGKIADPVSAPAGMSLDGEDPVAETLRAVIVSASDDYFSVADRLEQAADLFGSGSAEIRNPIVDSDTELPVIRSSEELAGLSQAELQAGADAARESAEQALEKLNEAKAFAERVVSALGQTAGRPASGDDPASGVLTGDWANAAMEQYAAENAADPELLDWQVKITVPGFDEEPGHACALSAAIISVMSNREDIRRVVERTAEEILEGM